MISPRYHRDKPQRYRLEAGKCKSCGAISFPPRLICNECKAREFSTINLKGEGKILTFTIIRVGPEKFSLNTPYAVGIVELDEGVRLTVQFTDVNLDDLEIGKRAKLVFRLIQNEGKSGLHCYGYKAVLA
jgi:uncharacterized OB-fold protein